MNSQQILTALSAEKVIMLLDVFSVNGNTIRLKPGINCNLNMQLIVALMEMLAKNPAITRLLLNNTFLFDIASYEMAERDFQKIDDFVAEENDYLSYLAKNLAKTAIEHIYLQSARFTQRGINALVGVEQLKSLNLAFTDIDNATAVKLAQHPRMKQLWIHDTKITDVSPFLQNNNLVFFRAGKFGQANEPMMSEVKIKINNNFARMGFHD